MSIYYYYILVVLLLLLYLHIDWSLCGIPYRLVDLLFGTYTKFTKKIGNDEKYSKLLLSFDDVMKKYGIPYWLSEGTALGVIRENRLLPWDDDLDVSFTDYYIDDFINKVLPELKKRGLKITHIMQNGTFFTFVDRYGNHLDVDIVSKGGKCIASFTKYTGWNKSCDDLMKHIKYFKNVQLFGRTFTVPDETYLEYLYGKDWKSPKKENKMALFFH